MLLQVSIPQPGRGSGVGLFVVVKGREVVFVPFWTSDIALFVVAEL